VSAEIFSVTKTSRTSEIAYISAANSSIRVSKRATSLAHLASSLTRSYSATARSAVLYSLKAMVSAISYSVSARATLL